MEQWKIIQEFPNYEVSNLGKVRRNDNGTIRLKTLRPNKKRNGYVYADLMDKGKRKNALVHRLVAQAFIPNPYNKPQVNHKNFLVYDNRVGNLEWCTAAENNQHSYTYGTRPAMRGELSGMSKLTNKTVLLILFNCLLNKIAYNKVAKMFNTNYSNVAHIMRGSRWGHLTEPARKFMQQLRLDANTTTYTIEDLENIIEQYS